MIFGSSVYREGLRHFISFVLVSYGTERVLMDDSVVRWVFQGRLECARRASYSRSMHQKMSQYSHCARSGTTDSYVEIGWWLAEFKMAEFQMAEFEKWRDSRWRALARVPECHILAL
jgi:hypothetical protein